jgi:hypothetical protein
MAFVNVLYIKPLGFLVGFVRVFPMDFFVDNPIIEP